METTDMGGSDGNERQDGLTEDQRADLAEAVEAETAVTEAEQNFQNFLDEVQKIPPLIYKLTGVENSGPAAYCRSLAMQKLEEMVHRMGDVMAYLRTRGQAHADAFQKAAQEGKIVQFPPRK